jgi:tetratricopeptide (TPR) repeat protein
VQHWLKLSTLALLLLAMPTPGLSYDALSASSQTQKPIGVMGKGFAHLSNFELDKSIICLAPLVVHYGSDLATEAKRKKCAQALALIGRSFQFDDNNLAAEQAFQLAHVLSPCDKTIAALAATMLSRTGRNVEAERSFRVLEKDSASNMMVATCLAIYYSRCADEPAARAVLTKALKSPSDQSSTTEANWLLGLSLVRELEPASVASYFQKAASSETNPYLKKLRLARALWCQDKRAEGEKLCREAAALLPKDPNWLMEISKTRQGTSPLEAVHLASKDFLAAAKCRRVCSFAFLRLTEYFAGMERFGDARKCVDYWKSLDPVSYECRLKSAHLYDEANEPALAAKELDEAMVLNPKASSVWIDLAEFKAKTKSKEEAVEILKKGTEACPKSARLWRSYAEQLLWSNHLTEARSAFEKALSLMPAEPRGLNILAKHNLGGVYAGLGTCAYKQGNIKEAFKYAKLFNELKIVIHLPGWLGLVHVRPDHLNFSQSGQADVLEHEALADMVYEMKQLDDCIKEYRLAVKGNPDDIDLHSFLFFAVREKNDLVGTMSEDLELANKIVMKIPSGLGDEIKKRFFSNQAK